MNTPRFLSSLGLVSALLWPTLGTAGEGHDHGQASPTVAGPASPRFAAESDHFELVGVLQGRQLTLYLDRAADNRPVTDAQLELEIAGVTRVAQRHDDTYQLMLDAEPTPGVLPVTATVTAQVGTQPVMELLAGELDLHAEDEPHPAGPGGIGRLALWGLAGLFALLVSLVAAWRVRWRGARAASLVLCAAGAVGLGAGLPSPAQADEGHDHGEAPAAPAAQGPQRLPDGRVFLPKPAQRQLGVRTWRTEDDEQPRAFELQGQVVMDPNAGGQVQALNAGRIEPGPRGLPSLGQVVRRGDVLAHVRPSLAPMERASRAAELAEWQAAQSLAGQRLLRLQALADTVPRKDIEAAESEARALAGRIAALQAGLNTREPLVAPVSGVIAAAHVVAGQVVDARERLFEIVDPGRLRIEALAYDTTLAGQVGPAHLVGPGEAVPLKFLGAGRRLREQAQPLLFAASGPTLPALALGQPVRLVVQGTARIKGVPVPMAALVKSPSNQTMVWVKTAPEFFEPRPVVAAPLDGARAMVTSGLKAGERVATQGATLINQVR